MGDPLFPMVTVWNEVYPDKICPWLCFNQRTLGFLIELSDKSNLKLNDISPLYESNYFNLTIK